MNKSIVRFINSIMMPVINQAYVERFFSDEVTALHGVIVGESSILFRGYEALVERQTPLAGSSSMDNCIRYEDIAIINSSRSFITILLWNGYQYSISQNSSMRNIINTYRKVDELPYWKLKKQVTAKEMSRNML